MAKRIVVAALIQRGEEYLFCWKTSDPKKNTHVDQYQMIGGGLEEGESLEEGLRREVREETGLEIKNIRFLSRKDVIIPSYKNTGKPMHIFYEEAIADYDHGTLTLSAELEKAIRLKRHQFQGYPINPESVRFLHHIGLYQAQAGPAHTPL